MADRDRDFKNILVIHFGQLGDVVLALPALRAIRESFPYAKIVALTGKVSGEVVRLSGLADEVIAVDRVELRDGPKLRSIRKILGLTRQLRRRDLDLVIDLHSLKETNLLAWVTRAKLRLLADRGNRSYHSLGNFVPAPPAEDRSLHLSRTYMRVLQPLGLDAEPEPFTTRSAREDIDNGRARLQQDVVAPLAGFFPGAGNPSRCWPLERFGKLSRYLQDDGYAPIVFLGPEERSMREAVEATFPTGTRVVDHLSIREFIDAASALAIFVTNDTGPMHLAALAGSPILLVIDSAAPLTYLPIAANIEVVNDAHIDEISVETVHSAARKLLARTHE